MFNKKVSGDTTPVAPDDESVLPIYPLPPRDRGQETQGVSLLTSSIFFPPCPLQWHIDPKEIEFTDRLGTGTSAQVYKGTKALLPFRTLLAPPPFRKAQPSFFASFFVFIIYYLLFIICVYN